MTFTSEIMDLDTICQVEWETLEDEKARSVIEDLMVCVTMTYSVAFRHEEVSLISLICME